MIMTGIAYLAAGYLLLRSAANPVRACQPARTIKVRGHETLVIRKSRPTGKPRPDSPSPHE